MTHFATASICACVSSAKLSRRILSGHARNLSISKGVVQSGVLAEVSVLEGGSLFAKFFGEVCGEVFHEVFGLVLLGQSEQQKNFSKDFSPKMPMALHSKTGEISGNLHDEVLQLANLSMDHSKALVRGVCCKLNILCKILKRCSV